MMSKNAKRPSADELREMADRSRDPVVGQALRQLAHDLEEEQAPDVRREASPDDA